MTLPIPQDEHAPDIVPANTIPADADVQNSLEDAIFQIWQNLKHHIQHSYVSTADKYLDEIVICLSEQQINDALLRFVTRNVDMVKDLHVDLHDDWLRLYATIYFRGIFASVATNLRLVDVTLSADSQRFVFEQIAQTDILSLHSKNHLHALGAKAALKSYRTALKKDPLPAILQAITVKDEPFAVHKDNYIYLDIHRYLAKQKKILGYLGKAQVNTGSTIEKNLLFKVKVNFGNLFNFGEAGENIITEKDNPEHLNP